MNFNTKDEVDYIALPHYLSPTHSLNFLEIYYSEENIQSTNTEALSFEA